MALPAELGRQVGARRRRQHPGDLASGGVQGVAQRVLLGVGQFVGGVDEDDAVCAGPSAARPKCGVDGPSTGAWLRSSGASSGRTRPSTLSRAPVQLQPPGQGVQQRPPLGGLALDQQHPAARQLQADATVEQPAVTEGGTEVLLATIADVSPGRRPVGQGELPGQRLALDVEGRQPPRRATSGATRRAVSEQFHHGRDEGHPHHERVQGHTDRQCEGDRLDRPVPVRERRRRRHWS